MSLSKRPKPLGISIGAARLRQAREFLVIHPDMSKSQAVAASGISEATLGRARRDLVAEGTLRPARNAPVRPAPEPEATQSPEVKTSEDAPPAASPAPKKSGVTLFDHTALLELAAMVDEATASGDDETIQKKLSKQALVFAFRTDLHPDTRMSASQMYYKLKDMAKAKDLGPGKPKTFADGVARLKDIHIACGPEMVMAAIHEAFTVQEASDGQATNDQTESSGGSSQTIGPAGHTSDSAPTEDMRPIDMELRRPDADRADEGIGHPNLSGPPSGWEGPPSDPRTTPHSHGDTPWG